MSSSRVVVYSAPGCHLCAPAIETVRRACGDAFDIVDITTDTELEQRYRTRIPLVTVDGVERFRYEVDEGALRELVTQRF